MKISGPPPIVLQMDTAEFAAFAATLRQVQERLRRFDMDSPLKTRLDRLKAAIKRVTSHPTAAAYFGEERRWFFVASDQPNGPLPRVLFKPTSLFAGSLTILAGSFDRLYDAWEALSETGITGMDHSADFEVSVDTGPGSIMVFAMRFPKVDLPRTVVPTEAGGEYRD